ncbi:hypothetical protein IH779_02595 [Patescibacteria group bacterium]|nr:hypothetical protein [Patescibacteria group bacterium]
MIPKLNLKLFLFIFLILALVAGGYGLFIWFVINIMKGSVAFGLLFVAVVAGVASFFNPCAFPLLPVYLAQYYTTKEGENKKPKEQLLLSGLAAALGLITFNLLLGVGIGILGAGFGKSLGLAGENPSISVRWLRGIAGIFILYLGFSHATGKGNPFGKLGHLWHPKSSPQEKQAKFRKLYAYGFGYSLLGIGCGGPIMAILFVFALSRGGFADAFLAFIIYSLVMAVLMIVVSLLIAFSKETLLQSLRQSTVAIQRVSGVLLLIVGAFLILSSIFITVFTNILFP